MSRKKKQDKLNEEIEKKLASGDFLLHIRKVKDGEKKGLVITIPDNSEDGLGA